MEDDRKQEWYFNKENEKRIPQLIGKRVIEVRHFQEGGFSEGWEIFFDDGSILTAQDGEYGNDAFEFIKERG